MCRLISATNDNPSPLLSLTTNHADDVATEAIYDALMTANVGLHDANIISHYHLLDLERNVVAKCSFIHAICAWLLVLSDVDKTIEEIFRRAR